MPLFQETDWSVVEAMRTRLMARGSPTVCDAAQQFALDFASTFSSVVLARVFAVVPLSSLPAADREFAAAAAPGDPRLRPSTRVLSLLGTHGREPEWRDRARSAAHRAIPLLDRSHVESAPMIARLLADLEVDFAALDDGRPIASRPMLGGRNSMFFVPDAQTARDDRGRFVIPGREFIASYGVRTVFGMGGAYLGGALAVAIFFTSEDVSRMVADRFASLISNFKIATSELAARDQIYG